MQALIIFAAALVSDIVVTPETLEFDGAHAEVMIKVENKGAQHVTTAAVACTFFDAAGKSLDISKVLVENIGSGETVYDKAVETLSSKPVKSSCRVERAR